MEVDVDAMLNDKSSQRCRASVNRSIATKHRWPWIESSSRCNRVCDHARSYVANGGRGNFGKRGYKFVSRIASVVTDTETQTQLSAPRSVAYCAKALGNSENIGRKVAVIVVDNLTGTCSLCRGRFFVQFSCTRFGSCARANAGRWKAQIVSNDHLAGRVAGVRACVRARALANSSLFST